MKMSDSNLKNHLQNQRTILLILLLSLIGFLLVAFLKSSFATIDANVNFWSESIHSTPITLIAKITHYGFDAPAMLVISLLIAAYLFYKNNKENALFLVGTMAGNAAIVTIVKVLVHSARPLNGLIHEEGFSFPSGHVANSVVLIGLLTYFIWQHWKSSKVKILSSIFFVVITLFVGFSRVYLNVHWLSDVIGAYLLGLSWLTFSILVFQVICESGRNRKAKFLC